MSLDSIVAAVLELRAAGASVVKIDPAGAVTVCFEGAPDPAVAQPQGSPSRTPAEVERELLFASADDE